MVPSWADQLLPQLLMEQLDTLPIHIVKKFILNTSLDDNKNMKQYLTCNKLTKQEDKRLALFQTQMSMFSQESTKFGSETQFRLKA